MYRPEADQLLESQRDFAYRADAGSVYELSDTGMFGNNLYQNMTPHSISVFSRSGVKIGTLGPCPTPPIRVKNFYTHIDDFLSKVNFDRVDNLPEEKADRYLIVSSVVKANCPDRLDLVTPGGHVRNQFGQVIGCTGFIM